MLKVAITGSTGLIGSRIIELLKDKFLFTPFLHSEIDICDNQQTIKAIQQMDFDIFLHLAGYTHVDRAEIEKDKAKSINVTGTENLFNAVFNKNKKFIYFSTDFVFDGKNPPYYEDSQPSPISYYGQTKYEGEKIVKDQAMIIRLSYPYRALFDKKLDFVRSIVNNLVQKKLLFMVTDSVFTPTFIDDIAYSVEHLMFNFTHEVFHITGADSMSPFEAGRIIANSFNLDKELVQPTKYNEYFKNKAKRPQYSDMKSEKNIFYPMKTFKESLSIMKSQIPNYK